MKYVSLYILFFIIINPLFSEAVQDLNICLTRSEKLAILDKAQEQAQADGGSYTVSFEAIPDFPVKRNYMTGADPEVSPELRDIVFTKAMREEIPESFDQREKNNVTDVRHQGQNATCWAFAFAGALETTALYWNKMTQPKHLSPQDMVNCLSFATETGVMPYMTDMETAHEYVRSTGLPYEMAETYQGNKKECRELERYFKCQKKFTVSGKDKIKAFVNSCGAAVVVVNLSSGFNGYSGGIYNTVGDASRPHAMVLVGWNDKEEYWIVRNSWGKSWGEKGYIRIKYGCDRLETMAWIVYP